MGSYNYHRQPGRQGLALLIVSAVVVLKHENSTLRQRHNFISIDFKFGGGDNVEEVTNPDKVGSGAMSGQDATWGNMYGYCDFKKTNFLYSSTELQPIPVNQFSRIIAQTTRSSVKKTLLGMRNV